MKFNKDFVITIILLLILLLGWACFTRAGLFPNYLDINILNPNYDLKMKKSNFDLSNELQKQQIVEGDIEIKKCIQQKINDFRNRNTNINGASLFIYFKKETSFSKANSVIQSYGLPPLKSSNRVGNSGLIYTDLYVPRYSQLKWYCILNNDENFEQIELSIPARAM